MSLKCMLESASVHLSTSFTRSCFRSSIHSSVRFCIHLSTRSFLPSFIRSFIQPVCQPASEPVAQVKVDACRMPLHAPVHKNVLASECNMLNTYTQIHKFTREYARAYMHAHMPPLCDEPHVCCVLNAQRLQAAFCLLLISYCKLVIRLHGGESSWQRLAEVCRRS